MFAGAQSLQSHLAVEIVACSYHDQIYLVVLEYFLIIGGVALVQGDGNG